MFSTLSQFLLYKSLNEDLLHIIIVSLCGTLHTTQKKLNTESAYTMHDHTIEFKGH